MTLPTVSENRFQGILCLRLLEWDCFCRLHSLRLLFYLLWRFFNISELAIFLVPSENNFFFEKFILLMFANNSICSVSYICWRLVVFVLSETCSTEMFFISGFSYYMQTEHFLLLESRVDSPSVLPLSWFNSRCWMCPECLLWYLISLLTFVYLSYIVLLLNTVFLVLT